MAVASVETKAINVSSNILVIALEYLILFLNLLTKQYPPASHSHPQTHHSGQHHHWQQ
jgi:hypothetical protein